MALTDKAIRALKATGERYEVYDPDFPRGSFSVRVTPTGERSFYLRYHNQDGRQRRVCLGAFPILPLSEARDKARRMMASVANGQDPAEERLRRRRAGTFKELWNTYMERYAKPRKKAWKFDEGIGERELLPAWKHRKAADITRADVIALLDTIVDRGSGVMANRTRAIISSCFNFGISRGLCEHNPVASVAKPTKEQSRDRVLTHEELKAVWKAIEAESVLTAASFKLRLLTAQRGIEVLSMRWEDISGDLWTIPADVSKNGLVHRVPLPPQAVAILDDARPISGSGVYVFPARSGLGHMTSINKAKARLRAVSKVKDFNPHDLRRTAATYMTGQLGIPRLVVSKILNHAEEGITAVYDRADYYGDIKTALGSWAQYLEALVKSEEEQAVAES